MNSTPATSPARFFEIRFSPRFSMTDTRRLNPFRLAGEGSVEIRDTEIVLRGKRSRPFWFGADQVVTIPVVAIVNAASEGARVFFEYKSEGSTERLTLFAQDVADATALAGALPSTKTEQFTQMLAETSDFAARLRAVSPTAHVTPSLVALNILVFIFTVWKGADFMAPDGQVMIGLGSDFAPLTTTGQWWRLFTSMFLHFGFFHLALNMWALWTTGPLVERLYGSGYFLLLYLLAGACGSVASIVWNPSVNSAGASGAIFGVFGAMLAFVSYKNAEVPASIVSQHKTSTMVFVAYNLFNGLAHAGIDNAAHIGGLIGGFAVGWLLVRPVTKEARAAMDLPKIVAACGLGLAVLACGVGSAYWRGPDFRNEQLFRVALLSYSAEEDRYFKLIKEKPLPKDEQAIAKRAEDELLPYWNRMSAALAIPKVSQHSRMHEFQRELSDYVGKRRDAFALLIEANRNGDSIASENASKLFEESNDAFAKLKAIKINW